MTGKKRPNRLGMYEDVRAVLDAALKSGGGDYELPDYGKAVWWRQRAYTFRKLYADIQYPTPSPYDTLSFKKVEEGGAVVKIVVGQQRGIFRPANAPLPVLQTKEVDPLQAVADELARNLGLNPDEDVL